jgi:xanthine dehydrogenase accessory factor
MNSLLHQLVSAVDSGRDVCYTTLAETRGSTPQKAGAQMLVFAGGCVEAEVKRRALALLSGGRSEILTFTLDHDYGWDDGLICGGRMKMLVDPVRSHDDIAYYRAYAELIGSGAGCTEAVALDEAVEAPLASQWLFNRRSELVAIRAGALSSLAQAPAAVREPLVPLNDRPRPYLVGGIAYLPQLPRCRLVIVGGGHVGQKVAELAAQVDFDVWVLDDRESYCNAERFPTAVRRICAPFDDVLPSLEIGGDDFCIIVTRGHQHDEQALYHLATRPARYVGMIGSRRKIKMIFDDLRREGIPQEALDRVHAPLGLDIGSQTVPEIAVSIVAELIAARNLRTNAARSACCHEL